jgi:hypothetical protein
MSSFDYNAPAELFLSKPAKGSRTRYRRFATAAEALRYAVEDLRIPKAFGAWLEVGMSASAAAKSSACTKPVRCATLSDRAVRALPNRRGDPHGCLRWLGEKGSISDTCQRLRKWGLVVAETNGDKGARFSPNIWQALRGYNVVVRSHPARGVAVMEALKRFCVAVEQIF